MTDMRLINVNTLRFEEFEGTRLPRYAIVSHRWKVNELSYEDFCKLRIPDFHGNLTGANLLRRVQDSIMNLSPAEGLRKTISACVQTAKDGLDYL